jgi:hypothetical protein
MLCLKDISNGQIELALINLPINGNLLFGSKLSKIKNLK